MNVSYAALKQLTQDLKQAREELRQCREDLAAVRAERDTAIRQLADASVLPASIQEALNSGDGTYRP